jgi:hypothetical protein
MKKILIATRNIDKFKIVSKLLKSVFSDYDYFSLNDINKEIIDKKENGDIINRSFEKAKNVFDSLKKDYDYIIGVDDGIKIQGIIRENVKDYVQSIINDELLDQNEIVYIARAYTFFSKEGNNYSILTEIPFKYKKLAYKLEIKKDTYPLSHVLTPLNSNIPVSKQSEEESNEYYEIYSKEKFIETKNYFDNK